MTTIINGDKEAVFTVTVDYNQSLHKMIAEGVYDEVSGDINGRNFPLRGWGCKAVKLTLIQFERALTPLEAVTPMSGRGYRSATIEELLALGKEQPDLQRRIPIVGLGSGLMKQGRRYAPCLGGSLSTRNLTLVVIYRRWSSCYRFVFASE